MPPTPDESSSSDAESSSSDQESSASDASSASSASESSSDSDAGKKELTPEQYQAELTRVRAEAANYRTRLRENEKKLANAKTPEEVEAALNELKETNAKAERDLIVENVALKHKLPEELAEVLRGDTREELEAHAEKLAKFVTPGGDGPSADELRGGLNPSGDRDADPDDPGELAAQYSSRGRGARLAKKKS